ncbi:MAG: thioredoxin domain-containing protein [Planctomycetota bacterium]
MVLTFGLLAPCGAAEPDKPLLTVLFTAETHAALLPCDCPLQPLGGVARRATLIKRYRERGPVLLVDAGGWHAGGIYDEDSDGDKARDELRTWLAASAMKLLRYDAISGHAGDECWKGQYEPATDVEGRRAGSGASALLVPLQHQAAENGARLWLRLPREHGGGPEDRPTAPVLILSRLGEADSTALANGLAAEALILNAGRKTSQRVWWRNGNATLANFDFQAQRLGVAEIYAAAPGSGRKFDIRVRHEALTSGIPDDPEIAALLQPYLAALKKKGKQRLEIEFWTMPECPGCAQACPELQRLAAELSGRVAMSLHFVTYKEDGKLQALHGERELQEASLQALVQKYYPSKIWEWLTWRSQKPDAPWQDGARALGLLAARLRGALARGEAAGLLEADHELMERRQVNGTPALVIGNRLYDDQIDRPHVLRVLCGLLDNPKPEACKDVPACFFDAQCRKRGFIARCLNPGTPAARCDTAQPAVKVPAIVVTDRENIYDNHEHILEILLGDLPGLDYRTVDLSEPEGRTLIEKARVSLLPAYFFDPVAKTEAGYAGGIGKVLHEDQNASWLVLQGAGTVGAHRLVKRPRLKGRVDLFVSRLSKSGQEALETALEYQQAAGKLAPEIVLHDALYWKVKSSAGAEQRELAAANGLAEIEEAARAAAVAKLAPEKLNAYLLERGKMRGSSYWDVPLRAVGLDPAKVREIAQASPPALGAPASPPTGSVLQALYAEADFLKSLDAAGEIVLLAENCELIPISSRRDLREVFERIGPRK